MQSWRGLAFRNVFRNWRLSLASVVATTLALTTASLLAGYYRDVEGLFRDMYTKRQMIGDFIVEPVAPAAALSHESQQFVEEVLKESEEAPVSARFLGLGGLASNGNASTVFAGFGYDVVSGEILRGPHWKWNVMAGRPLSAGSVASQEIVSGRGFAEIVGCTLPPGLKFVNDARGLEAVERPITCESGSLLQLSVTTGSGRLNAVNVRLAGIVDGGFREADMRLVAMPLEVAQGLLDTRDVSFYSVRTRSEKGAQLLRERLNARARERGLPLRAVTWEQHSLGELFLRTMSMSAIFKNFIATVVLAVTGMSLLNTHVKAVHERTREIGMLLSLGFTRRKVLFLFGTEGALLALLGILMGSVLFFAAGAFVNLLHIEYKAGMLSQPVLFRIALLPEVPLPYGVVLLALSVVSLLVPVWRVTRGRISDALIAE